MLLVATRPALAEDADGDAEPPPLPRAAVLVLTAGGAPATLADNLTEILIAAVSRLDRFEIVGKEEFQAILGVSSEKRALTCLHDTTCLSKVGMELGIAEVVVGNVSVRGKTHALALDRVDVRQAKVIRHLFHEDPAGPDGLFEVMFDLADQLFAAEEPTPTEGGGEGGTKPPSGGGQAGDGDAPPPRPVPPGGGGAFPAREVALWSAAGVGVIAGIAGAVFGVRIQNAKVDIESRCSTAPCDLTRKDALDRRDELEGWATAANVLYGVSAAAVGTAVALFLLGGDEAAPPASSTVVPAATPDGGATVTWRLSF